MENSKKELTINDLFSDSYKLKYSDNNSSIYLLDENDNPITNLIDIKSWSFLYKEFNNDYDKVLDFQNKLGNFILESLKEKIDKENNNSHEVKKNN